MSLEGAGTGGSRQPGVRARHAIWEEEKGRRAQELTQEDADVNQRQDARSVGLEAGGGGSCQRSPPALSADTSFC